MVLPVVSLLPFLNRNMDQKFAVLSKGPNYASEEGYNTLEQARDDGALVLAWGYGMPCGSSAFAFVWECSASKYLF